MKTVGVQRIQIIGLRGLCRLVCAAGGAALLSVNAGCSLVAQPVFAQLAMSGGRLEPTTTPPDRAGLDAKSNAFLDTAQNGATGQLAFDDQTLQVTIMEDYYAANGNYCKKAVVKADQTYPEQQLAVCKQTDKDGWRLTRSILSSVTF